jgi:hypothetical protein
MKVLQTQERFAVVMKTCEDEGLLSLFAAHSRPIDTSVEEEPKWRKPKSVLCTSQYRQKLKQCSIQRQNELAVKPAAKRPESLRLAFLP